MVCRVCGRGRIRPLWYVANAVLDSSAAMLTVKLVRRPLLRQRQPEGAVGELGGELGVGAQPSSATAQATHRLARMDQVIPEDDAFHATIRLIERGKVRDTGILRTGSMHRIVGA